MHTLTVDSVAALANVLPFDPSMIMGVTLAPETGGYSLASQMTDDSSILMFNGVILAGLLGQLISFQFPVFMAALDRTVSQQYYQRQIYRRDIRNDILEV